MILGVLADKDPKIVLDKFSAELGDENSPAQWPLRTALAKWAETEPAAAASWLDRQIAAGKFQSKALDGKNNFRLRMESAVVSRLLTSDPAVATARVKALPEDQREDFFRQGFFSQNDKETDGAAANLVRETLPPGKVADVLADQAESIAMQGGYERVDGFIASANANEAEKNAIVASVMKNKLNQNGGKEISREEIDKARAWGATQSPAAVDKATGDILAGTLWSGGNFKDASAMALQYNQQAGNDDVLAAFLKSSPVRHKSASEAIPLIGQIQDPALRAEIEAMPQYKDQLAKP